MNRSILPFLIVILFTLSCASPQQSTTLQYTGYRIEKNIPADTGMQNMLTPYVTAMRSTMDRVIGFTNENMTAKQPESAIGNFLADCIQQMAEKKFKKKVDAGFINQTGIRSYFPKGNITVGKVFEIMPFDNLIVLQQVKGATLKSFFDKMANDGGWPVSAGVRYVIKEKKAISIIINGKPLDENALYTIANSDYIANGGDNCEMLRPVPQQNIGYLLRDGIIDYITDLTRQGKPVDGRIENRVSHAN